MIPTQTSRRTEIGAFASSQHEAFVSIYNLILDEGIEGGGAVSFELTLEEKTPHSLNSHFCEVGVSNPSKFPYFYCLPSEAPWIHSCLKYFNMSQSLNLIIWLNID